MVGRHRASAGEDRGLELRVHARLRAPQLLDEGEELRWVVSLEGQHELLVVETEGVARVYLDRGILVAYLEVLCHDPLPLDEGQPVPLLFFTKG